MAKPKVRVGADELRTLVTATFTAKGMTPDYSAQMADAFVWANLRGVDSHGVSRVPRYIELFDKGEAELKPDLKIERPRTAALLLDAKRAPGPIAVGYAMNEAVNTAKETGIASAVVRGTVHTGAIGYYTSIAAREGMVGIGIVAGVPNMGYTGAKGAAVATSPLSIAIPASSHPDVVLDMATAGIALGKIAQYKINGLELPEGMATTADGTPTIDPNEAKIPLPMAGAKGAGMSLVFELLASGLASNPIVPEFHNGAKGHRQNATVIAIDVTAFLPLADYEKNTDATIDAIKGLPAAGDEPILYPGERGAASLEERNKDGIPLPVPTWEGLAEAAKSFGVEVPEVGAPA